jgi:hypothetical protein
MSISLHTSHSRRVLQACLLAALFSTAASAQQGLTFTPFHSNGIYQPGEKVGWTVTGSDSATGPARFDYEIKKNEREVLRSATLDLSSGTATIEAVLDEPCMVFVELKPEGSSWASGVHREDHSPVWERPSLPTGSGHLFRDPPISTIFGPPSSKQCEQSPWIPSSRR